MATLTRLKLIRDDGSFPQTLPDSSRDFASLNQQLLLTADTVATVVVPDDIDYGASVLGSGRMMAYFRVSPNKTLLVLPAATPALALPINDTEAATLAQMNPGGRVVTPGQTLQLITPDTDVYVVIEYYGIPK